MLPGWIWAMVDRKPVLLAILDGWGEGKPVASNAIHMARTPNMDALRGKYPATTLLAHNGAVGLPEGQMGNSEVGHLNIGAGRVVYQDYSRINRAIATGELVENTELVKLTDQCRQSKGALHLLGLVSDGGVHSHIDHLVAMVELAAARGLTEVFVHAFMDGRDTPPSSGLSYMEQLTKELERIGVGRVATISGRYYAMDRDNRWSRVEKAWQALVDGEGIEASDPLTAMNKAYDRGETDEFIIPMVMMADNEPVARISDGDGVLFFNFRADRARELTRAFISPDFDGFGQRQRPDLSCFLTMTEYDRDFGQPIVFPPQSLERILGEEVSKHGVRQLRIAETEKYAHVTFFFNGGREEPYPLEDRILIPSPQEVATYDEKPQMSAPAVADRLLTELDGDRYGLIILNFANADMVGHTGILPAAIAGCEAVDECMGKVVSKVRQLGGIVLITADHGNAEIMEDDETGESFTAHSLSQVPFILVDDDAEDVVLRQGGALRDIAPTILNLMGIEVPAEMDGDNLIK